MNKHAYLIMAHNEEDLLKKLMSCLDHERNDIYIHLDKKSNLNVELFSGNNICKKSLVYFTERISVNWGGFSQIEAELILLENAVKNGPYCYYHLLTGVDLPLKTQDEILNFFDSHQGKQFISLKECNDEKEYINRVKYYYPTQERVSRNSIWGRIIKKGLCLCQMVIGIDRLKAFKYGIGSAYFDITDEFAKYVISQRKVINKYFKMTECADEMFLQTIYLNSKGFERFQNPENKHMYIQETYFDVLRAIDWNRGRPYIFRNDDYDMLMNSKCLFARKFSSAIDDRIIERIVDKITE